MQKFGNKCMNFSKIEMEKHTQINIFQNRKSKIQ
jgi:hypothetical protein